MTLDETLKVYKNLNRVCRLLKISPQNMTKWKEQGYIPYKQQFILSALSNGKLLPDKEDPVVVKRRNKAKRRD